MKKYTKATLSAFAALLLLLCAGAALLTAPQRAHATPAPCNTSKLYDGIFSLAYDDAVTYPAALRYARTYLASPRSGPSVRAEALAHFKSAFGMDFGPGAAPANVTLQAASFDGYELFAAMTPQVRFINRPLYNVRVDGMYAVVDERGLAGQAAQVLPEGSFAAYGYYSFYHKSNGTKAFEDMKFYTQSFMYPLQDQSLDFEYRVESATFGLGSSYGVAVSPMRDPSTGLYHIGLRETITFPPMLTDGTRRGLVSECQTLDV